MKILWVCNIMPPAIAEQLNREGSNKEGWLSGLLEALLTGESNSGQHDTFGHPLTLAVAFPVPAEDCFGNHNKEVFLLYGSSVTAYGFVEDTVKPETYDPALENPMAQIFADFEPDIVHCFGAEYGHTLAACRAFPEKDRILIGIQGLCSAIAEVYTKGIPEEIISRRTLRDILKKDSIRQQQEKFRMRGQREQEAFCLAGNVTGRTPWDEEVVTGWNPRVKYYPMNETLRSCFYEGQWQLETCEPHSVFISQGDYPIKGLHDALLALPMILQKYPDAKYYIAGNSIANYSTLKEKIKISGYGKYLYDLIQENRLAGKVVFLGKMTAEEMKERYLMSHLFLCCSHIENSPNSLGEAMLLGVPCVAANVGGISGIFEGGADGILYEDGCDVPERIAQAVISMWGNVDKMLEYTQNARKHARVTHNRGENHRKMVEIYADMLRL